MISPSDKDQIEVNGNYSTPTISEFLKEYHWDKFSSKRKWSLAESVKEKGLNDKKKTNTASNDLYKLVLYNSYNQFIKM